MDSGMSSGLTSPVWRRSDASAKDGRRGPVAMTTSWRKALPALLPLSSLSTLMLPRLPNKNQFPIY